MLKRVTTSDIELGMFIHKLEGSWFSHPFWKSKFLLDDPDMLASLRESDVDGVIIDVSRGNDVVERKQRTLARAASAPVAVPPAALARPTFAQPAFVRPPTTMPIAREFGRAKRTMGDALKVVGKTFIEARLGKAINAQDVEPVIDAIYASVQRNLYAFNGLLRCQNGSEFIYRHSLAVSALMIAMARHMKFGPLEIRDAGMTGLLMDIGVGQLPVDLSAVGSDYAQLPTNLKDQHVLLGCAFLKAAGDIPAPVVNAVLQHHERLDGSGYPQGISGAEIDRLSRMAAICDAYDTLASSSGAALGLDPAEAIRTLRAQPEKFDATLLEKLEETIGVYPVGSFVRMRSNRLAMVVDEDPSDPLSPTVRTFWSIDLGKRLKGKTITLAQCLAKMPLKALQI